MIPLPQVEEEPSGWVKLEGAVAHQTLINGASIMLRRQGDEVIIPRSEIAGTLIDCYVTVYVHADSGDLKLKFHDPRSKWARATPGIEPGHA